MLYKLWEGSWEDDAVVRDRETGVFTDPSKVHEHRARAAPTSRCPASTSSEPSPQRTPVIYQAGASSRGIAFAAGNAEAIFVAAPTEARARRRRSRKIRDALEAAGRDRYAAQIYTLLTIITDETPEKAQAKYEDYLVVRRARRAPSCSCPGWMGIDLSQYDLDEPIGNVKSNAIQSVVAQLPGGEPRTAASGRSRDIARHGAIGGLGARSSSAPASEIADQLQEWVAETDVDGFNLAYAITPGTFEDIVEFVIPELQRRGVYPTEYAPGTLRQKLHGRGDRLPDEHHGAAYKLAPVR